MLSLFVVRKCYMGCIVEEDLDFRGKVNKVLGNKSFIAFLSLFDFIQKQNYV